MIAKIVLLIALIVISGFFIYLFFTKEPLNKAYLKYIFYAFPFLGIDLLPSILSFNIFDLLTLTFFFIFYQPSRAVVLHANIYNYIFLIFLLLISVGIYISDANSRDTITAVIQLGTIYLFIMILYKELRANKSIKQELFRAMKYVLIFSFVFLFLQYVFGPSFSFAKSENINVAGGMAIRYPSFFQDPQKYAQFLAIISFIILIQFQNHSPKSHLFSISLVIFSASALMLTGGRSGLGGWIFGLFILGIFSNTKHRLQLFFLLGVVGLISFVYQEDLPIFKRAGLEESYLFRQVIWIDALKIYEYHPWFGIGIANYANYVSMYHPDQYWVHNNEITYFDHPESGYLKLLVEFGRFGFLCFILLLIVPIYKGYLAFRKQKNIEIILYIIAIISWMIGFYTVYSLGDVRIKILIATVFVLLIHLTESEKHIFNSFQFENA